MCWMIDVLEDIRIVPSDPQIAGKDPCMLHAALQKAERSSEYLYLDNRSC